MPRATGGTHGNLEDAEWSIGRGRVDVTVGNPGAKSGSARSALFGYAVLRANYNHNAPSYLDNFTGFVLDILAERQPEPLGEGDVGQAVRERFGLTIPDKVVGLLLKRAVKSNKADTQDHKRYTLNKNALGGVATLGATIAEFEIKQTELLNKFRDFVASHHSDRLALIEADPDRHLHEFIEQHAAPLLRRAERGQRSSETSWGDLQGPEYLVAAFILHLAEHDALTFGYVVDAVKGAILTGVLDLGPGDLKRDLSGLTIVLDTPVLLKGLGYHGPVQQRAIQQTLDLALALGVTTVCFEHTRTEIDHVLESVLPVLRSGGTSSGYLRAIDAYFLDIGADPADIALHQGNLAENLENLGVKAIGEPGNHYQYGLDESSLDDVLKKYLPMQREATRRYDVRSLSALHRLRRGSGAGSFERCGCVLATDNVGLVVASLHVDERHDWPLAMLDSDVAALLWVRSPAVAEDLPREQLLAAVYAGMQPGSHLWMRYVEEIERLETRGSVTSDEALVLRSRPEARRALMDVTLGEAGYVDEDSVGAVVERVRETLEGPLRSELGLVEAERDQARRDADGANEVAVRTKGEAAAELELLRDRFGASERQRRELERQKAEQGARIQDRSRKRAGTTISAVMTLSAAVLAVFGGVRLLAPKVMAGMPAWVGVASLACAVVLFAVEVLEGLHGGSVKEWLRPVEERLARRLERRARRRAGFASEV